MRNGINLPHEDVTPKKGWARTFVLSNNLNQRHHEQPEEGGRNGPSHMQQHELHLYQLHLRPLVHLHRGQLQLQLRALPMDSEGGCGHYSIQHRQDPFRTTTMQSPRDRRGLLLFRLRRSRVASVQLSVDGRVRVGQQAFGRSLLLPLLAVPHWYWSWVAVLRRGSSGF